MTDETTPNPANDQTSNNQISNDQISNDNTPQGRDWGGARSLIAVLALALSTGLMTKLMWTHESQPQRVVQFDITKIHTGETNSKIVTARTRTIYVSGSGRRTASTAAATKQIQLPSGLWIDCRGNCASAYLNSGFR